MVDKMKDVTAGVAIEEFGQLEPKMYSYLVDNNSDQKNGKSVNKNVAAAISHNEYKDVLLNKKCLRYSMNSIQSRDHKIGTYEIYRISLSCINDKVFIKNNGCDSFVRGYSS